MRTIADPRPQLRHRLPSRDAVRRTMTTLAGCAVIIGGIAGADELAGWLAR